MKAKNCLSGLGVGFVFVTDVGRAGERGRL